MEQALRRRCPPGQLGQRYAAPRTRATALQAYRVAKSEFNAIKLGLGWVSEGENDLHTDARSHQGLSCMQWEPPLARLHHNEGVQFNFMARCPAPQPSSCADCLSSNHTPLRCFAAAFFRWSTGGEYDVVLSSGFLAFANHSGFLQAVEEVRSRSAELRTLLWVCQSSAAFALLCRGCTADRRRQPIAIVAASSITTPPSTQSPNPTRPPHQAGIHVSGVMGTSAGALAGSLYAAGYSPREVAEHLRASPPIQMLKPCWEPWRGGLLSLEAVIDRLSQLLPPTFEDLERDFAVGVVTAEGEHVLIDSGPLPEAVAASAAIPFVFSSVDVPGASAGDLSGSFSRPLDVRFPSLAGHPLPRLPAVLSLQPLTTHSPRPFVTHTRRQVRLPA